MGEYYDPCLLSICYHSKRERVDLANVSRVAKVMISHKLTKSCFTSQQRRDVVLCQRGFWGVVIYIMPLIILLMKRLV